MYLLFEDSISIQAYCSNCGPLEREATTSSTAAHSSNHCCLNSTSTIPLKPHSLSTDSFLSNYHNGFSFFFHSLSAFFSFIRSLSAYYQYMSDAKLAADDRPGINKPWPFGPPPVFVNKAFTQSHPFIHILSPLLWDFRGRAE